MFPFNRTRDKTKPIVNLAYTGLKTSTVAIDGIEMIELIQTRAKSGEIRPKLASVD